MIVFHFLFAILLLITRAHATVLDPIAKRDPTPDVEVLGCSTAQPDSFEDKAGKRYQLMAVGPTRPGGEVQTYQNTAETSGRQTFRLAISALSTDEMVFNLINFKSGDPTAPPNSLNQIARYRVNIFDRKGVAHSTILWLKGYEKCRYTIKNPPDIDDHYVLNIVVMNTIPAAKGT